MSSIIRRGKRSYNKNMLLIEIQKELGITETPTNSCPIPKLPEQMPVDFCTNICYKPCESFMNFEFILRKCFEESCNVDSPCAVCIEEIEKYKTYFRCLKSLDLEEVEKYRTQKYQVEKYLSKHGLKK